MVAGDTFLSEKTTASGLLPLAFGDVVLVTTIMGLLAFPPRQPVF